MALPSGYTRLAYLQSSGTQYIDTGLSMPKGFRVVAGITWTTVSGVFIGSYTNTSPYYRNFFGVATSGVWQVGHLGYSQFGTVKTDTYYAIDYKNVQGAMHCTINGEVQTLNTSGTTSDARSELNLYLFGANVDGAFNNGTSLKCRFCQIYDESGTLVRDFVPCTNASGVAGMYDKVNGVFYTNAGTGTFTAGPEPTPGSAHHTMVDGSVWGVVGGRCLVEGTAYDIKKGRALVGGTGYDISFEPDPVPVEITIKNPTYYSAPLCASIVIGENTYYGSTSGVTVTVYSGDTIKFVPNPCIWLNWFGEGGGASYSTITKTVPDGISSMLINIENDDNSSSITVTKTS